MNDSTVAVVGSGIAATAIAWVLVRRGYKVVLFEKGPTYPYPHDEQFREQWYYLHKNPKRVLGADLDRLTTSGDYRWQNWERKLVVGGSCTVWTGTSIRMHPNDFQTKSQYNFGVDWPIGYDELEPYYCDAEAMLGIAGTDTDNPFAAPRSRPYPLPPFELSKTDRMFAGRLRGGEIILHTTPQARTRLKYDGRPKCKNIGTCDMCPIGARYSPNEHLQRLEASGQLQILPDTSVRRIVMDSDGRARAVVYRRHGETADREHAARAIVVAAGAIECVRLLLMSSDTRHPGGIGNRFGQVGQHVAFHHVWNGTLRYPKKVFAGRIGPSTAMCHQFRDPPSRGRHGGLHTEFSESLIGNFQISGDDRTGAEALDRLQQLPYLRGIEFHAETVLSAGRAISLSKERDRFGDPFAHLHYESTDFDRVSYRYAQGVLDRFAQLTEGEIVSFLPMEEYTSAAHHMGGCRMGAGAKDSVVDTYGRVHETPNLYVAGSAIFPSCSGSVPPTLTLVALALRTAGAIASALT